MKEKTFVVLIIFSLILINVYSLNKIRNYKQKLGMDIANGCNNVENKNDELNSYKLNFETNILNSNFKIDSLIIRDTLNNILQIKELFKREQKQFLVCRFSQLNCESCVISSINALRNWIDSIGINNVMFLGNHPNNRIFTRTLSLYGIQTMKVYNVVEFSIPAEQLGYPYYFVLNSNLCISDIFVPNKSFPNITNLYLSHIKERYFPTCQN
jgi:hypothetical protein